MLSEEKINCKPFLRWAGGKTWLVKKYEHYLPQNGIGNYHELFLGGGAVFFHLQPKRAFLSDVNNELIETYVSIKEDVENVIDELSKFKNTKEFYYKVRNSKPRKPSIKAAKFIYLNQTSFNGIYRVNLNGEYNVPYGFRKKDFFEPENLFKVSTLLQNCELSSTDFHNNIDRIERNDVVFLDPPYTVTHYDNGFIKYNQKLFSLEDQERLSRTIDVIKEIGAYYILSNAAHPKVKEIFKKDGDKIYIVKRASLIGGKKAKRGSYAEYIFTNI